MVDVLAPLMDLPGVTDAADAARDAVDALLRHRAMRRSAGRVSAASALRGAQASAELEGRAHADLDVLLAGIVTDPVTQGALRVSRELAALTPSWGRTPRQVLARLDVLAGRGVVSDELLGRPLWATSQLDRESLAGDREERAGRLDALLAVVSTGVPTAAPAVIVAAVVHGELLSIQPFAGPNGVVARAAGRLTAAARGLDPVLAGIPEIGHLRRHPEYVGSLNAYRTGTPDGVRSWLRHCCIAVGEGAEAASAICDEMLDG